MCLQPLGWGCICCVGVRFGAALSTAVFMRWTVVFPLLIYIFVMAVFVAVLSTV